MAATVLIACKAPNGLVLDLDRCERIGETQDVRVIKGGRAVLKGWAHAFGKPDMTEETGGYALTQVDADFWASWIKVNADSPLIADRIILPPHNKDTPGLAREHVAVPQMFKPASTDMVKGVQAEARAA